MQSELIKIRPDALNSGDVLLSSDPSLTSKLIKTISKSDYSHAALYDGQQIIEAVFDGVEKNNLQERIADEEYMDAYRFVSGGNTLGDFGWPAEPVIRRAEYYCEPGQKYAYRELFFLLVLLRVQYGWALKRFWRFFIQKYLSIPELKEKFEAHIDRKEKDKEPVICSELVYRCFAEATADQKYKLSIQPWGRRLLKSDPLGFRASSSSAMPEQKIVTYFEETLAEVEDYYQKRKPARVSSKARGKKTTKPDPVLDLVTPRDLQYSKNLKLIGRLERSNQAIKGGRP